MARNGQKWQEMAGDGSKLQEMAQNGRKWQKNGLKWLEISRNYVELSCYILYTSYVQQANVQPMGYMSILRIQLCCLGKADFFLSHFDI